MATAVKKKTNGPSGPASDPMLTQKATSYGPASSGPASDISWKASKTQAIPSPPGDLASTFNVTAPPPSNTMVNATASITPGYSVVDSNPVSTDGYNLTRKFTNKSAKDYGFDLDREREDSERTLKYQQLLDGLGDYTPSDMTLGYKDKLQGVEGDKPDPFNSRYETQIQGILDTIYNRKAFDINNDANYQQLYDLYKQQYTAQADKAMRDTMASAQAATGGYGSTYAGAAAQQAYDSTMQQLNDRNLQLMQLAYGMYADERANDYQKLGAYQGQDDIEYGRYRDTVSDWQRDRDYYKQAYFDSDNSDYSKYSNDRNFYGDMYWKSVNDDESKYQYDKNYDLSRYQFEKNFDYNDYQFEKNYDLNRYQYDDSSDYNRYNDAVTMAMSLAEKGLPVPDYLTTAINKYNTSHGLSENDAMSQLAGLAAMATAGSGGGSGRGRGGSKKTETPEMTDEEFNTAISKITNNHSNKTKDTTNPNDPSGRLGWVNVTGLGRVSFSELDELVDKGEVIEEKVGDGNYHYRKATSKDKKK